MSKSISTWRKREDKGLSINLPTVMPKVHPFAIAHLPNNSLIESSDRGSNPPPYTGASRRRNPDRKRPFLRYLSLNQVAHVEEEDSALQPKEMKQAELTSCRWRIPRPSSDFERQTFPQLTKLVLHLSKEVDRKKFLMHLSIDLKNRNRERKDHGNVPRHAR